MASFTEASNQASLNGTSEVTVVAAPAASKRRIVRAVFVKNVDTVTQTITIRFDDDSNNYDFSFELETGWSAEWTTPIILDGTTDNLRILMGQAATTTNPYFIATYAEVED